MTNNLKEHHIVIEKTARYYTLGEITTKTRNVWIVCHGYAQLARDFITEFSSLVDEENYFVAPEGLSRFYTKGFFGKPGATWMTKEDRANEIADYVNYLDNIFVELRELAHDNVKYQALGFSQGCATICRWMTVKQPEFDQLWICSGEIPPDIDWTIFNQLSKNHDFHYLYGLNDPMIGENDINTKISQLKEGDLNINVHSFEGAHEIDIGKIKEILYSL